MISDSDAAIRLLFEFASLEGHFQALRQGAVGGVTALRLRLDRLEIPAFAADPWGRYLAANTPAAALTGYEVSELERMSVWELTPGADAHAGERLWSAFIEAGEQRGVYTLLGKHGPIPNVYYHARTHVLPDVHVALLYPLTVD